MNTGPERKKVLITGGTGTLGQALVRTAVTGRLNWDITVFSRDHLKQVAMKRQYPDVRYVIGDIADYEAIYRTATGHDIIIHAAANKHIPACEDNPLEAVRINVLGSQNVAIAAAEAGVRRVVGISTDKVCQPESVYGMTKAIMERMFVRYADAHEGVTSFHLCRYGNVLGSNGSVLQVWDRQSELGDKLTLTDAAMTRFWLSEADAVDIVMAALIAPTGWIVIPKAPAAPMSQLAAAFHPQAEYRVVGRRPGEKSPEVLVAESEVRRLLDGGKYLFLTPEIQDDKGVLMSEYFQKGYSSDNPVRWLNGEEIRAMVD
jgi:UDP-N-acetylglucosamine 4,6-dehydratase